MRKKISTTAQSDRTKAENKVFKKKAKTYIHTNTQYSFFFSRKNAGGLQKIA